MTARNKYKRTYMTIFLIFGTLSAMLLFAVLTAGCLESQWDSPVITSDDYSEVCEAKEEGSFRCANEIVERCKFGIWRLWEDCNQLIPVGVCDVLGTDSLDYECYQQPPADAGDDAGDTDTASK